MPFHQKLLTGILLLLTGMLLGALLMLMRGNLIPPERVQVRYTEVPRGPVEPDTLPAVPFSSPAALFGDIAERVIPAVVYIESEIALQQAVPDDEHHPFEDSFWERFLPRRRAHSIGSGVLISRDGYILTNHHVIQGADRRIRVMTYDSKQFKATVIGSDPSTDLAVIKIASDIPAPMVIGNSDRVRIGDWVMAIGNPFRLRSTVTAGIVSAVGRDVDIITDRMRIESFIQTDAAINRGNSGGALVNTNGELIGINTAIASESGTYQGYGFAVPVNMAMKIGQDLIEHGTVQRAFLGVEITSVDYKQARKYRLTRVGGVEVRSLLPGGSADLGGLQQGDVILAVNNFPVDAANRLQERIALLRPGDEVVLRVWRDHASLDLTFPLKGLEDDTIREWASVPSTPPQPMEFEADPESGVPQRSFNAGFTVAELAVLEEMSRNELVVIRVEQDSPSYKAGLRTEDVITHLNGSPVTSLKALEASWDQNNESGLMLRVQRNDESIEIVIPSTP